ncbi:MAG: choice-of-anchor D domain-containing protein [Candidatus Coatesbacteria bacterium]|nr:choice-of-anchor D domain-containing protein [Candidatus Coatesbacteria bacterium]
MDVYQGDSAASCRQYREDNGYHVDFGWDEYEEVAANYMGSGYPTSVAIDCQDPPIVVWTRSGLCEDTDRTNYCVQNLQEQIENDWLPLCNDAPELSNPDYDPAFGRTDTDFNFYIDYFDPDGDAPNEIIVFVNGTPHAMSLDTGTADNGTYVWTGTISQEGQAQFYFYCSDGRGGEDTTGNYNGPYVYDDYDPPSSSCSAPSRSQSNTITVDYTSSDADSGVSRVDLWMQCAGGGYSLIDTSTNQNGSFNVNLNSGNAVYDFYTRATDLVGNLEDAPGTEDASTIFDNTAPDSSVDPSLEYYWNNLPVQIDFDADDNLSGVDYIDLWYRYEGGSWTDSGLTASGVAGTFNFDAPQGQGGYEFYTISTDLNGNVETAPTSAQADVLYDATLPVSSCSTIPQTNADTIGISFNASDNDEVDDTDLWYQFEGGAWTYTGQTMSGVSGTFNYTFGQGDGVYGFYTISHDMATNVENPPASADTAIRLDQTMPESNCTADALIGELPFDIQFTASDAGTGVASTKLYYRYEGETQWQDGYQTKPGESGLFSLDPTVITPQYGDGNYELMTICTDNVGNKEAPPAAPDQTVTLDTTPPSSFVTCNSMSPTSPLQLDYTANDSLSGLSSVTLWYNFNGGDWVDSGLSDTFGTSGNSINVENGSFTFSFPHGDGVYGFLTIAADIAGNNETPGMADCTCSFDTTSPNTTGQTDGVVNDPTIQINYQSVDALTAVANVRLYYKYTDLEGEADATLYDTGLDETAPAGTFVWAPDRGPGYYYFYFSATDTAGNTEATSGAADTSCLYDPRLALSNMTAPGYVTEPSVAIQFTTDIGNDGFDHVTLYYRFGETLSEAESADWTATDTISTEQAGTLNFACPDGDGFYQFFTRATSGSWLLEPIPDVADGTTLFDGVAPETTITGPAISANSQFNLNYTTVEAYGLVSIDIYYEYGGTWSLYTTVTQMNGVVVFNTQGNEGVYSFYTIGTDVAGNVEDVPVAGYDCTVTADLNPPISQASVDTYGTGFPIEVIYTASDTVTPVTNVSLWVKYGNGPWTSTGLSGAGDLGTLYYTPASAVEGIYRFYTSAVDEAGHSEVSPSSDPDQITIDWTPPVTTCSSPALSSEPEVDVSYTGTDLLSGMSSVSAWIYASGVWQDTGLLGPADSGVITVDVSAWGEGSFGFCVLGRDNCGNVEGLPAVPPTATLYDMTKPTSAAGLPAGGLYANTSPVAIPYTANDAASGVASASLWYKFNGGAWLNSGLSNTPSGLSPMADGSFSFIPPSGDGTYQFATRALDNAGNLEDLPATPDGGALVFDQTAPSSSVSFDGTYAIAFPIVLDYVAADSTAGIDEVSLFVSVDGGAYVDTNLTGTATAGQFSYTPDTLVAGTYRFYSVAKDKADNVESAAASADATVIFDTIPPVSSAKVSKAYANAFPISVSFTSTDAGTGLVETRLWASFNNGVYTDTGLFSANKSGTFKYLPGTLADGTYSFYTRSSDIAGNVEAAPDEADASIVVDRIAPTSSCSIDGTVANSFPLSIDYTSSDSGSGVDHVELFYRLNGGAWTLVTSLTDASGTYDFTPAPIADGRYEFYTKAYDHASNVEATAGSEDGVSVDTTPPTSSAFTPEGTVASLPFYVLFNSRDDASGVSTTTLWYSFNGGAWLDSGLEKSGTVGQFEFSAPDGEGTYRFYTICQDMVGNVEAAPSVQDGSTRYHVPKPEVEISDESLSFGEVNVGGQAMQSLFISNVGDTNLIVQDILSDDAAFTVSIMGTFPKTLGPGAAVLCTVIFAPDEDGEFDAELSIETNDPLSPIMTVALSGTGIEVEGEFVADIWANGQVFAFNDTLMVEMRIWNTDDPVDIDLSAELVFNLGGADEQVWSAVDGGWVAGESLYASAMSIETGYDETTELLSTTLPCKLPMVVKSGVYTLRLSAMEAGTSNLIADEVVETFVLDGDPFVAISVDKATYSSLGDTISISLNALVPYGVTADYYVIMFTPDGSFWAPTGFGAVPWVSDAVPLFAGLELEGVFTFSGVAFVADLPASAPFDLPGNYTIYTGLVEPGTLSPISDLGMATFTIE